MDSGPEHSYFYQIFNHNGVIGTAGVGLQTDKGGK
jgi:hypothetical protein